MTTEASLQFRKALGQFATGVTVISTEKDGKLHGMTANAFSSVSLDPPLILVCVDKKATTHDLLLQTKQFVVNILSKEQEELSNLFAKKDKDLSEVQYERGPFGPYFAENLATLHCTLYTTYPGGDHTIFLGEVMMLDIKGGEPLMFFDGRYM